MLPLRKRWLVGVSLLITATQFVFLGIGSSKIGTVVYKLMLVSLNLVDQSVVPTLWATRDGWPLPTVFGYGLYAAFSSVIVFIALWGIGTLGGLFKREPIQTTRDNARDVT